MIIMYFVGFDSKALKKTTFTPEGEQKGVFKAKLGASVTTNDEDTLREKYDQLLGDVFEQYGIERKKSVYKAAHLLMQAKEKTPEIISTFINNLEDCIEHIDVYCAYYSREYISMCGRSTLRRLRPMVFIEKTKNAFPHVCAWWYVKKRSHIEKPLLLEIDHFDGMVTPAWRELKDSGVDFQVFFSGDECNALISLADMVLKLIEIFHHGSVDGRTLLRPVREYCKSFVGKRKLWFHNLGDTGPKIKATAPDIHLHMNVTPYFKHPIFYSVWDPGRPRTRVKKSFEWSPVYNATANRAFENKGAMKSLSFDQDVTFWDPKTDFLIAWSKVDEKYLEMLQNMGYELPKILKKQDLC